jgi:hypothetical protein
MNLILYLTPDTEAKLKAHIAETGKDAETLAIEALEEKLSCRADSEELLPKTVRLAKFRALIASMPKENPGRCFARVGLWRPR